MPPGRPAKWKDIDLHQLEQCAEKQWTYEEIAAHFRVHHLTIRRHFEQNIKDARQRGLTKLRDLQWLRASKGSDTVLIHMSKHYLKQHEKQITEDVTPPAKKLTEEELEAELARLRSI